MFSDRSGMFEHHVLVVGDDIDIFNFNDVMWAYTTGCRPGVDDFYFHDVLGFALVPYQSQGQGPPDVATKIVSNCLLPSEYKPGKNWVSGDFEQGFTEEVKQRFCQSGSRWAFDLGDVVPHDQSSQAYASARYQAASRTKFIS
jgi:3-polyprenyl-4-hydroxybenzoate decarboxylase